MTSSNTPTADDERAVRAILDCIYAAWENNDAEAFVAEYADDATATLPGAYLGDKETIRASMADGFAGPLKGSRGLFDVLGMRSVATGVMVVNTTSGIAFGGASEPAPGTEARDTWTLSRRDGSWLVDVYHSTPAKVA